MLKDLIDSKSSKSRIRPGFLPFKSCADLLAFNHATEEDYTDLVSIIFFK